MKLNDATVEVLRRIGEIDYRVRRLYKKMAKTPRTEDEEHRWSTLVGLHMAIKGFREEWDEDLLFCPCCDTPTYIDLILRAFYNKYARDEHSDFSTMSFRRLQKGRLGRAN